MQGKDTNIAIYALTTDQGTAAYETALCGDCVQIPSVRVMIDRGAYSDVSASAEYVDYSRNTELECQNCGARA